jgi:general secretion pathway protein E
MADNEITDITKTEAPESELNTEAVENLTHVKSADELGLGWRLVQSNLISQEQLDAAIQEQIDSGYAHRLGAILIEQKLITESQLLELLAKQLEIPFVQFIADREIPEELIKKVPTRFAKKFQILPVGYISTPGPVVTKEIDLSDKIPGSDKTEAIDSLEQKNEDEMQYVQVVTADPLNTTVIDDIRLLLELPVKIAAAPSHIIMEAINRSYDRASTADEAIQDLDTEGIDDSALDEPVDLLDSEDEAPIIRLVNSLLFRAVKDRASDLHVEPYEREVAVRFRIDGDLYDILKIPKRLQSAVTSRIKLLGQLNIAEKRLPQDGRIKIKIAGKDIDIRLSTVPTSHGERIVLRLLDKSQGILNLKTIGFDSEILTKMEELIARPYGIILVTGPTGSGKTTTLYSCLSQINREDINIITVEDPVEYQLQGVGQIQVSEKIGLTFPGALRSVLRQDPDVVLIGEIRDRETAEIAVQASLTGHLVLSTIHTNDAASSIARLVDMGVEPFLVSSSLVGILAQRLVRRVCEHCKVPYSATSEELAQLGLDKIPTHATIFRATGCERCYRTGYSGRIGIFELLPVDDDFRTAILKASDAISLKREALKKGFKSMRHDGLRKILQGVTTIEEVLSTTQEDSKPEN